MRFTVGGVDMPGVDMPADVAITVAAVLGIDIQHQCGPDCPDRPPVYDGPVILGRRCTVCLGPTDGPLNSRCSTCTAAGRRAR